jgi:hypothetical protein
LIKRLTEHLFASCFCRHADTAAGGGGLPKGGGEAAEEERPAKRTSQAAAEGEPPAKRANQAAAGEEPLARLATQAAAGGEPAAGEEPPAKQAKSGAAAAGGEPAAGEEPPAKQAKSGAAAAGRGAKRAAAEGGRPRKLAKPAAAAAADAESDDEGEMCCKCKSARDSGNMLLCGPEGHCPCAYHIYCLDPPLESLPEGDWFCPECTSRQAAAAEFVKVGNIVLLRLDPSTLKRGWDICQVTKVDGKGGFAGVYLMPQVHGSGSDGQQAADWPEGWEEGDLVEMMAGKKPWEFRFNKLEAGVAACWGSKLEQQGGCKKWRMASSDAAGLKGAIASLAASAAVAPEGSLAAAAGGPVGALAAAPPAAAPAAAAAEPAAAPAAAAGAQVADALEVRAGDRILLCKSVLYKKQDGGKQRNYLLFEGVLETVTDTTLIVNKASVEQLQAPKEYELPDVLAVDRASFQPALSRKGRFAQFRTC